MIYFWTIFGIAAIIYVIFVLSRQRKYAEQSDSVSLSDIPNVYQALKSTGQDGSFAIFIPPKRPSDEEHLNIQFSIEGGTIGLDWVLISATNIRDRDKFVEILDAKRAPHRELRMNDVSYVRTEDSRAAQICRSVLEDMYGVSGGAGVELMVDDFEWPVSDP